MRLAKSTAALFALTFSTSALSFAQAVTCPDGAPYFQNTTTTLTVTPAHPVTGQSILLTAAVAPTAAVEAWNGHNGVDFTFLKGDSSYNPVVTGGGYQGDAVWTETIAPLPAGTYSIYANYEGERYCLYPSDDVDSITVTQAGGAGAPALKGTYAFALKGTINPTGEPSSAAAAIGKFYADGAGNIKDGQLEFNSKDGYHNSDLLGTYTLDANGVGTATLYGSLFPSHTTLKFAIYVPAAQASSKVSTGQIVETDQGLYTTSGTFALQTQQTAATMAGSYVFGETGEAFSGPGTPALIFVGGTIALTDNPRAAQISYTEIAPGLPSLSSTATGSFSSSGSRSSRFELDLQPGDVDDPQRFTIYPIDASHFYMMSTRDPIKVPLLSGYATRQ